METIQAKAKQGRPLKKEIFEDIYEMIKDRINMPGQIKPGDVFILVCHKYSYCISNRIFAQIMGYLVTMKRAEHIGHGVWKITKVGNN